MTGCFCSKDRITDGQLSVCTPTTRTLGEIDFVATATPEIAGTYKRGGADCSPNSVPSGTDVFKSNFHFVQPRLFSVRSKCPQLA